MATSPNPYRGFRFPAEVIEHAVWLYHCFSLSLREVELILAARGIVVSYETIREWGLRFGRLFANALKRRRPRPGDKTVCLLRRGKVVRLAVCPVRGLHRVEPRLASSTGDGPWTSLPPSSAWMCTKPPSALALQKPGERERRAS